MSRILVFSLLLTTFVALFGCRGPTIENTKDLISFTNGKCDIYLVDIDTKKVIKLISSTDTIWYNTTFWLDENHLAYTLDYFNVPGPTPEPLGVYNFSKGRDKIIDPNSPYINFANPARYDDSTVIYKLLMYHINLININTMDTINIVDVYKFGIRQRARDLEISPDKNMIIFASIDSAKNKLLTHYESRATEATDTLNDIYKYNIQLDSLVQLTDNNFCDRDPTWSPDGESIAFSSDRSGNFEIYVMDKNGKNLKQLTNDPGEDIYPEYSPTGDRIAFISDRSDRMYQIWLMNIDGSDVKQLTDLKKQTFGPLSWSPVK